MTSSLAEGSPEVCMKFGMAEVSAGVVLFFLRAKVPDSNGSFGTLSSHVLCSLLHKGIKVKVTFVGISK